MLPASRSGDRATLHPLRAAGVSRMPARGVGRFALRRLREGGRAERPATGRHLRPPREHARDEDHHRRHGRRVRAHRRSGRRELRRHRPDGLRSRALRALRAPGRMVASVLRVARARRLPPPLLQHAPLVDRRADPRAGRRAAAVRPALRRLGRGRIGGRVARGSPRVLGGCVGRRVRRRRRGDDRDAAPGRALLGHGLRAAPADQLVSRLLRSHQRLDRRRTSAARSAACSRPRR